MTINERIIELRKKRNWSQEELAIKCGYKSKSTISKIESGARDITKSKILVFATVFGVSPSYLLNGEINNSNVIENLFRGLTNDEIIKVTEYIKFIKSQRGTKNE